MWHNVIIGMLPGQRLGLVRQCIECRAAAGIDATPCPGFGPGCLGATRPKEPARPAKPA